jgi:DNA-binding IclR family transcriptional regulator
MTENDTLAFAAASLSSLWSLELLLHLKKKSGQPQAPDELIRELRSSQTVVTDVLVALRERGLVTEVETGRWCYCPSSDEAELAVAHLEQLYAVKPAAVIRAIVSSPDRKLRLLSDAFKITE